MSPILLSNTIKAVLGAVFLDSGRNMDVLDNVTSVLRFVPIME